MVKTKEAPEDFAQFLAQIGKKYKAPVQRLGDQQTVAIDVIPTGSLPLDAALGVGGIPRGRITEIYGPESSGKTTLGIHLLKSAMEIGEVAYLDAENAFDPEYGAACGLDVKRLITAQPDTAEDFLGIIRDFVKYGKFAMILLDSVAAISPRAELDGEIGEAHVGLLPRLLSQTFRMIVGDLQRSQTALVIINQLRDKIGVMFGSPETTTGGKALKFYASCRIDMRRKENLKKGDTDVGILARCKIVKNKMAPPFREAMIQIDFGKGVNRAVGILDTGLTLGLIERAGSWYSYQGNKIGNGKDGVLLYFVEHPEVADAIEATARAQLLSRQTLHLDDFSNGSTSVSELSSVL